MRKKLSDIKIEESGIVRKIGEIKELKNRLIELGILNTFHIDIQNYLFYIKLLKRN